MSYRITACRTCRARIFWARSATTKKTQPIDADPHAEGTIRAEVAAAKSMEPTTTVLVRDVLVAARAAGEPLYRSHFATCPQAGEHRRSA